MTINLEGLDQSIKKVQAGKMLDGSEQANAERLTVTMSPEEIRSVSDSMFDTAAVDESTYSRFRRGYAEGYNSIVDSTAKILQTHVPELNFKVSLFENEDGEFDWGAGLKLHGYKDVVGEDFDNLNTDQRRQRLNDIEKAHVAQLYGNVMPDGLAHTLGQFTRPLVDPTTVLIPAGSSVKAAAAIGSGLGATDAVLNGMAEEGEIDWTDVAIATTIGGVLSPLMYVGGKKVSGWIKDIQSQGLPVTPKQVQEFAAQVGAEGKSVDPAAVSAAINKSLFGDMDPISAAVKKANDGLNPAKITDPEQALATIRIAKASDDFAKASPEMKALLESTQSKLNQVVKPRMRVTAEMNKVASDASKSTKPRTKPNTAAEAATKKASIKVAQNVGDAQEQQVARLSDVMPRDNHGNIDADFIASANSSGRASEGSLSMEEALAKTIHELDVPWQDSSVGKILYNKVGKVHFLDQPIDGDKAKDLATSFLSHRWAERPSHYLKRLGTEGRELAARLQKGHQDYLMFVGQKHTDLKKALLYNKVKPGSADYDDIVAVLRNQKKPGQVSVGAAKAAATIREKFDRAVKDAVAVGIIPRKQGVKLLTNARKNGYFPRIYDQMKLSSSKGKQLFVERLQDYKFSTEQVNEITNKLLREGTEKLETRLAQSFSKQADGSWKIKPDAAKRLYRNRTLMSTEKKSYHLEHGRKLLIPDEVLEPFLVNDLEHVYKEYISDVYKRISMAKYLGADGEVVGQLAPRIEKNFPGHGNEALEVYHSMIGSIESPNVRKFVELPDALRKFYGTMASIESTKLVLAQTLNMTQALINGSILLANRTGSNPKKMASIMGKGLYRALSKEGREFSERVGAAAQNTIMQVNGELGDFGSRWTTGVLKYSGFTAVEKAQRTFAANMGRAYVEDLLENQAKLQARQATARLPNRAAKALKKIERQLLEMGLDPEVAPMSQRIDDLNRAAQLFSNEVNFLTSPDMLPLGWQSPHMKIVRQFKSFAFLQGAFIKDNVFKPALKGNVGPALMLAGAGFAGMPADQFRQWIYGDDRERTNFENYLGGFTAIGGLGMLWDLSVRASRGPGEIPLQLVGPAYSDMLKLATGVAQSAERIGNQEGKSVTEPAVKGALSFVPLGGKIKKELYKKGKSGPMSSSPFGRKEKASPFK